MLGTQQLVAAALGSFGLCTASALGWVLKKDVRKFSLLREGQSEKAAVRHSSDRASFLPSHSAPAPKTTLPTHRQVWATQSNVRSFRSGKEGYHFQTLHLSCFQL